VRAQQLLVAWMYVSNIVRGIQYLQEQARTRTRTTTTTTTTTARSSSKHTHMHTSAVISYMHDSVEGSQNLDSS
jgi:hypothetical protein